MKHTPGPWILDKCFGTNDVDCGYEVLEHRAVDEFDYRGAICRVTDAAHIDGISRQERDANARLIAAAPDMLSLLRETLQPGAYGLGSTLAQRIEACLAKATGETQ